MHASSTRVPILVLLLALVGCSSGEEPGTDESAGPDTTDAPTFAEDVAFLEQHGSVHVMEAPSGGRVATSAAFQGRVMTSAVGPNGRSLGWVNREFIASDTSGTAFDNYGGEDRFWLGPEGGQYGLYFPAPEAYDPDRAEELFTLGNWQVPPELQEGRWTLERRTDSSVTYARQMRVQNVRGTVFQVRVDRTIRLLGPVEVGKHWGEQPNQAIDWVAYETINRITNIGDAAWTRESGLLSVWILGQYEPFGTSWVVIPYRGERDPAMVTDAYFGSVPDDRLAVRDGYVLFKADGQYRSKIGVGPDRAVPVLGSYNRSQRLVTVLSYSDPQADAPYVNSLWRHQDAPYAGSAVHSYNDGPPEPGEPALGGFYELETSSRALALEPGEAHTHVHRTLHVTGPRTHLDAITEVALGVPGEEIAEGIPAE